MTPLQNLIDIVLERTGGGKRSDVLSDTRGPLKAAQQRRIAMYLHFECLGKNFTTTGKAFNRDRTTVRHAWEQTRVSRAKSKDFDLKIKNMRAALVARNIIST